MYARATTKLDPRRSFKKAIRKQIVIKTSLMKTRQRISFEKQRLLPKSKLFQVCRQVFVAALNSLALLRFVSTVECKQKLNL